MTAPSTSNTDGRRGYPEGTPVPPIAPVDDWNKVHAEERRHADDAHLRDLEPDPGPDMHDRFIAGGAFILDQPAGIPALWGEGDDVLWAAGEALWIVGPSGVGKTTITGQLVRGRLGLADSVLGRPVETDDRRVLYLAMDRPRQVARAMRRNFGEDHRQVLDDRLVVWPGPPPADLARRPELLLYLANLAGAGTVVIDSVKDAAVGLCDDEVGAGFNRAVQGALAAGIEVLAQHHQRKGQGNEPKSLADVYGSTWLTAGAGSVILLWGAPGDLLVELRHLKQPGAEVGPLKIEHDHTTGTSTVWRGFNLLAFLRHQPKGATARDVAIASTEKQDPTENEVKKAKRSLDKLTTVDPPLAHKIDAHVGGEGGSTGARYYLVETSS